MPEPIRNLPLVVAVAGAVLAVSSALPNAARAYHTHKERLLDSTAYSLYRREARIGIMKVSYGIIDQLQVTTYTMPWILGAALEDVAPNLELKSTFFDKRRLALSASVGFATGKVEVLTIPTNPLEEPFESKVLYLVLPMSLAASVRINPILRTHVGGMYTSVTTTGDSQTSGNAIHGTAAVDLLQLWGMLEWKVSRVTALTLTVRWVPYAADPIVRGTLQIDPDTGAIIGVEVDIIDLNHAAAIIPGAVFSWKRANVRVGLGYGDFFFVEGLGLVAPGELLQYLSFEFDVFVRF